jgi:flavin-dependent dehydrogenase
MISAWGSPVPVETDFVRNVHGPGWHVDRRQFDSMLAKEAAKAGAQLHARSRVGTCERQGDCWAVGERRSRFLVDACGRNGLRIHGDLEQQAASKTEREIEDELIAIALTISYSYVQQRPPDLRTCVETTPRGWWYAAPLPDATSMAMFFTDPEIYRNQGIAISDELKAAPITARRLEGGSIQDSRVLHVTSSCRRVIAGLGWLAVGDSASSYDPLSGRGVFKALQHARAAATAITGILHGQADPVSLYSAQVRLEFEEYVRQRRQYYAAERRWLDHSFWRRRSLSSLPSLPPLPWQPR